MSFVEPEAITISTICNGAVTEVFARELAEVLANIADPNTEAEKPRGLTLKFTFKPLEDRQGAIVSFSCLPTLQPAQVAKSPVFLSKHTGSLQAYALDHRQASLFGADNMKSNTVTVIK